MGKHASNKAGSDDDVDDVDVEPTVDASGSPVNPENKAMAASNAHETVMRITEVVAQAIDALAEGEKTTLKELQAMVAERTGLKGSNIGPVISMIVKEYGGVTVELGRYGGIYKGVRVKPEKQPDNKVRCTHCKQVIRQKTGPRKKKDAPAVVAAATTEDPAEDEEDDDDDDDDDDSDDSEEN